MDGDAPTLADVLEVENLEWVEGFPLCLDAGFRLRDGRYAGWSLRLGRPPGQMQGYEIFPLGAF